MPDNLGANPGILIGLISSIMLLIATGFATKWYRAANKKDLRNISGVLAPFSALVVFISGGTWAASGWLGTINPERIIGSYFQFLVYILGPVGFACVVWVALIIFTDADNAAAKADSRA